MPALLFFAFLSGLVTIAAPCIWPLLPIVLSSSIMGNDHRRPLGVTLGILVSFGILTLTISYLVSFLGFDPNILRVFAVIVLLFLGFTMIFPPLTRVVEGLVSKFAGRFGQNQNQGGFAGGFITGLTLGVVWTPCAGPILAAIATLAATRAVNFEIVLVTIAYLVGVGIPLFIFAYAGQRIINRSRSLNKYTGVIQKVFGLLMIVTALLIATNYDKTIQAKLLNLFPSYSNFIVSLESNKSVQEQLDKISGRKDEMVGKPFTPMNDINDPNSVLNSNFKASEIVGINNWLNTNGKSYTLKELKGKVVLVDFWTYTCINCIRTLPHVVSWYEKYKDKGFVVIGVHTPEFEFEKDTQNVSNAIKQYEISYPVAQDNDYVTWRSFENRYWPAEYLIDKDGIVRRVHFGEGEYDEMEEAIQILLMQTGQKIDEGLSNMPDETPKQRNSPETYLGSLRMEYYFPNGNISNGVYDLTLSKDIALNSFTLGGKWIISDEYSTSGEGSVLEYSFVADKIFLVMKPISGNSKTVKVFLDGKQIPDSAAGKDVKNGVITVDSDRLYEVVDLRKDRGEHLLRLEFSNGIQVFAFTSG